MGFNFDKQSVRRISRSVQYTERRDRSRQVRGRRQRHRVTDESFDRIKALSVGAFTAGNSTITVDNVVPTKGPDPLNTPGDPTEQLVVANDLGLSGSDNELVYAEFHVDDGAWHLYEPPGEGTTSLIAKTSPGAPIAARSGVTLSSQSCEIFKIEASALVTTGVFQTVYNIGDTAIPQDFFVEAAQDENSGLWFAEPPGGGGNAVIFKTSPGLPIAARSGETVSTESCQIFLISGTTLVDTATTKPIYNLSDTEIPGDHYGVAVQEVNSNLWVAESPGASGGEAIIFQSSSTISARSGTTLGFATVNTYEINGVTAELEATGEQETVYNMAQHAFSNGAYGQAKKERTSGLFVIDFEDCE